MPSILYSAGFNTGVVYKHSGITAAIAAIIPTPYTNELTGITLKRDRHLISANSNVSRIFVHSGISSSIASSFSSPSTYITSLAYLTSLDLVSLDTDSRRIYVHLGTSSTIQSAIPSPNIFPSGVAVRSEGPSGSLVSSDGNVSSIFRHAGVSSSILSSFSSPGYFSTGLALDESENLISSDGALEVIYIHSGISSVITSQFSYLSGVSPYGLYSDNTSASSNYVKASAKIVIAGISMDVSYVKSKTRIETPGASVAFAYVYSAARLSRMQYNEDLVSNDLESSFIFLHSGMSGTITTSFRSPSYDPYTVGDLAIREDTGDLLSVWPAEFTVYIHSGISSQIRTAIRAPWGVSGGTRVDGVEILPDGNLAISDTRQDIIRVHDGISFSSLYSFSSPGSFCTALTVSASGDLISLDESIQRVYIHFGVSSTIRSSFAPAESGILRGIAVDAGGSLVTTRTLSGSPGRIYVQEGLETAVAFSFQSPALYPKGIVSAPRVSSRYAHVKSSAAVYIPVAPTQYIRCYADVRLISVGFTSFVDASCSLTAPGANLASFVDASCTLTAPGANLASFVDASCTLIAPGANLASFVFGAANVTVSAGPYLLLISMANFPGEIQIRSGIAMSTLDSFPTPNNSTTSLAVDTSGNIVSLDFSGGAIYVYPRFIGGQISNFSLPNYFIRGVAVDQSNNLLSADTNNDLVYVHSGISSTITSSFVLLNDSVRGLAIDQSGNLISAYQRSARIFIHSGVSDTVSDNFNSPGIDFTKDITVDPSNNLLSLDYSTEKIYIHSGISATVSSSRQVLFAAGIAVTDAIARLGYVKSEGYVALAFLDYVQSSTIVAEASFILSSASLWSEFVFDYLKSSTAIDAPSGSARNLITATLSPTLITIHSGATTTITSTFATPGTSPDGLTVDGSNNLISCDDITNKIYVHSNITSSINSSFAAPDSLIQGLTLDNSANLISTGRGTDKIFVHSGISATITTSFAGGPNSTGLTVTASGNLLSTYINTPFIRTHAGISATITSSFAYPYATPRDMTLDVSGNLVVADLGNLIHIFSGISSTLASSMELTGTIGGITFSEIGYASDYVKSSSALVSPVDYIESSCVLFGPMWQAYNYLVADENFGSIGHDGLVSDLNGTVFFTATFVSGTPNHLKVYKSIDDGQTWSLVQDITSVHNAPPYAMHLDTANRLHLCYWPVSGTYQYKRYDPPDYTLAIDELAGGSADSSSPTGITATSDGTVYIFYQMSKSPAPQNYDIRYGRRTGTATWVMDTTLAAGVSGAGNWEADYLLSSDGSTIYFVVHLPGVLNAVTVKKLVGTTVTTLFALSGSQTNTHNSWLLEVDGIPRLYTSVNDSVSGSANILYCTAAGGTTTLFTSSRSLDALRGVSQDISGVNIFYGEGSGTLYRRFHSASGALTEEVVAVAAPTSYLLGQRATFGVGYPRKVAGGAGIYRQPAGSTRFFRGVLRYGDFINSSCALNAQIEGVKSSALLFPLWDFLLSSVTVLGGAADYISSTILLQVSDLEHTLSSTLLLASALDYTLSSTTTIADTGLDYVKSFANAQYGYLDYTSSLTVLEVSTESYIISSANVQEGVADLVLSSAIIDAHTADYIISSVELRNESSEFVFSIILVRATDYYFVNSSTTIALSEVFFDFTKSSCDITVPSESFVSSSCQIKIAEASYIISLAALQIMTGGGLTSCDLTTRRLYTHQNISEIIISSFLFAGIRPNGIDVFQSEDVAVCDVDGSAVYIYSGASSSIKSSFSVPYASPSGLSLDLSENLAISSQSTKLIYIHSGATSTISSSFLAPDTSGGGSVPIGLGTDTFGNLVSAVTSGHIWGNQSKISIHSGFSSTIVSSFENAAESTSLLITGVDVDDFDNLLSCDIVAQKIRIHDGITATVATSFSSPGPEPSGLGIRLSQVAIDYVPASISLIIEIKEFVLSSASVETAQQQEVLSGCHLVVGSIDIDGFVGSSTILQADGESFVASDTELNLPGTVEYVSSTSSLQISTIEYIASSANVIGVFAARDYCRDARDFRGMLGSYALNNGYGYDALWESWGGSGGHGADYTSARHLSAANPAGSNIQNTIFSNGYLNRESIAPQNRIQNFVAGNYYIWVYVNGGTAANAHGVTVGSNPEVVVASGNSTWSWKLVGNYFVDAAATIQFRFTNPDGYLHAIRTVCLKDQPGAPTDAPTGDEGDNSLSFSFGIQEVSSRTVLEIKDRLYTKSSTKIQAVDTSFIQGSSKIAVVETIKGKVDLNGESRWESIVSSASVSLSTIEYVIGRCSLDGESQSEYVVASASLNIEVQDHIKSLVALDGESFYTFVKSAPRLLTFIYESVKCAAELESFPLQDTFSIIVPEITFFRDSYTIVSDAAPMLFQDTYSIVETIAFSGSFKDSFDIVSASIYDTYPLGFSATAVPSGGTIPSATTYYYRITGINATGETASSPEVFAITIANSSSILLQWSALTGAAGYKIYRTTVSGSYGANSLLTTISGGGIVSYIDVGDATSPGVPPAETTINTDVQIIKIRVP